MSQSNQILGQSPLDKTSILEQDQDTGEYRMSSTWVKWFDNIYQTVNQYFSPYRSVPTGSNATNPPLTFGLSSASELTQDQIDALQNLPDNNVFLFNLTTNKYNFRQNGAWVELP